MSSASLSSIRNPSGVQRATFTLSNFHVYSSNSSSRLKDRIIGTLATVFSSSLQYPVDEQDLTVIGAPKPSYVISCGTWRIDFSCRGRLADQLQRHVDSQDWAEKTMIRNEELFGDHRDQYAFITSQLSDEKAAIMDIINIIGRLIWLEKPRDVTVFASPTAVEVRYSGEDKYEQGLEELMGMEPDYVKRGLQAITDTGRELVKSYVVDQSMYCPPGMFIAVGRLLDVDSSEPINTFFSPIAYS